MDNAYHQLLSDIKATIRQERQKAIRQLNRSLISVYWEIGRHIIERQQHEASKDFPNLRQLVAEIPWGYAIFQTASEELPRL
ncbi:MAG: DUF1016 N-terminal domain-containing protein [Saprospiraceae bacterium]